MKNGRLGGQRQLQLGVEDAGRAAPQVAALRGPVELVSFPGQGHGGPYVYADPERWDAVVRAFLDRL